MKKTSSFLTALFALLCIAPQVMAHALHVFAQYDGQTLSGKSYYSDMTPAAETYMEVWRQGENQPSFSSKTDKNGYFSFSVTADPTLPLKVVVEGEEGHRAEVIADSVLAATPSSTNQANDDVLLLLRSDIAQLRDKIFLHDILGGIGYIVGIAGIAAWWNARKLRKGNQ